ncbi:hypothetical protein [Aliarcobacter butzleri]|jgi:hypothetical protein|uniref:Uncharacterized protein n=6 Tax=Aliarcobacter butzleri TaxID=28197 RepID=A8EV22_ALIB4|nr:hypothetical protein [Aliarcobacter butzleri]ABV67795.1 hypothetical protein Abu_1546 [Aliarcobacter butzleri RM4018]EFU68876.1 conserved hypothetical protein [Aliarcobacter butzleri JV22]KLD96741.1 hypothetical protein AF74_08600 [Aliarcobacter butzleri L349]KLE04104.1 hypothetical protein AF78_09700 [Aliarcobacter butzleri L353]KLE06538.1 hypothetical protein AF77_01480 [Aliarcobacter butzleri L352]
MVGAIFEGLKMIFKTITKLSRPYVSLEENDLKFKIDSDNTFKYTLSNIDTKTRHDPYIIDAYTLSANEIYLEYIHTDIDVSWNGQALSFFISLLKDNIKAKNFDLVEKEEFSHYEFLTYKVDNSYFLNVIYIYEVSKEVFIVDKKAELYEKLLKNFKKDYVYRFEKDSNNIPKIENLSLVKNNAMNSYFAISSN